MKDEYERIYDLLGEETMKKLDAGFWANEHAIDDLIKDMNDEMLVSIVGDLSHEDEEMFYNVTKKLVRLRMQAKTELALRPIVARAEKVMALPGASGVFCVYHNCDMKDCVQHHKDD